MGDRRALPTLSPRFTWRADNLEWPLTSEVGQGLAGAVVSTTEVCWLDPSSGLLSYRGVPIEDLVAAPDFEAAAHLLFTGPDGDAARLDRFRTALRQARSLPPEVVSFIRDQPAATHPTRLLRAAVSALGCHEMSAADDLGGARHWREPRIVGQVVALLTEIIRYRNGLSSTPTPGSRSLTDGMLDTLLARPPRPSETRALDLLWVLYAAHGMDAPTFTSMVVASCLADPYSNVVAGLSAMRGHQQGGTGEFVLRQLLELGCEDEARSWVADTIARGDRIAGFGHRVYRMPDPRVVWLRKATATLARDLGRDQLFEIARAVEQEATRLLTKRGVHININFYASVLFHLLGADPELVPCLFSVARLAGLNALVHESLDRIRLHRPLARYVGHPPREFQR